MVYRESTPIPEVSRTQIPEIDRWIDLEERFGELTAEELWKVGSGEPEGRRYSIHHFVVSGDGSTMLVTDADLMWSVDTHTMTAQRVEPAPDDVRAVALDDLARTLFVVDGTDLVRFCRAADGSWSSPETIASAPSFDTSYCLRVNAPGTIAVVAQRSASSQMHVVDIAAREISFSRTITCDDDLLLHPSGQVLISRTNDSIYIRNSQGDVQRLKGWGVALNRDGNTLAVVQSGALHLYKLDASGAVMRTPFQMSARADSFRAMAFSPDGSFVVGNDDGIRLMELEPPNRILTVGEGNYSTDLGVLADGRVASTYDAEVRICTRDGVQLGTLSPMRVGTGVLIGRVPLGFYGALDGARPANPPHERPQAVSAGLGGAGGPGFDQREALLLSELSARTQLVHELLARQTADAAPDRRMAVAAGILGLLPELIFRTEASLTARPGFGPPQVRIADLEAVAAELRRLTPIERRQTLGAMVQRMAGAAAQQRAATEVQQRAVEEQKSRLSSKIKKAPKLFGALAALVVGFVAIAIAGGVPSPSMGVGSIWLLTGGGIGLPFVYMGTAALINPSASFRYGEYSSSTGYVDGKAVRISKRTGTGNARFTRTSATFMLLLGLACVGGGLWGALA